MINGFLSLVTVVALFISLGIPETRTEWLLLFLCYSLSCITLYLYDILAELKRKRL